MNKITKKNFLKSQNDHMHDQKAQNGQKSQKSQTEQTIKKLKMISNLNFKMIKKHL